jgi:hypothetical protein
VVVSVALNSVGGPIHEYDMVTEFLAVVDVRTQGCSEVPLGKKG